MAVYINKGLVDKILDSAATIEEAKDRIEQCQKFILPPREGYWRHLGQDGFEFYECSICGYHNITAPYFCERCGGRMTNVKKDDTI